MRGWMQGRWRRHAPSCCSSRSRRSRFHKRDPKRGVTTTWWKSECKTIYKEKSQLNLPLRILADSLRSCSSVKICQLINEQLFYHVRYNNDIVLSRLKYWSHRISLMISSSRPEAASFPMISLICSRLNVI